MIVVAPKVTVIRAQVSSVFRRSSTTSRIPAPGAAWPRAKTNGCSPALRTTSASCTGTAPTAHRPSPAVKAQDRPRLQSRHPPPHSKIPNLPPHGFVRQADLCGLLGRGRWYAGPVGARRNRWPSARTPDLPGQWPWVLISGSTRIPVDLARHVTRAASQMTRHAGVRARHHLMWAGARVPQQRRGTDLL